MGKYINTRTEDATLTPFKRCCLENFPFIEEDFDSVTNYQLYCKVVEYLNKVIDQTNINTADTQDFINKFIELKNYVDNFFNNLDVQDEINNKLDQMATDGTLTDIIAQYLKLAGVLVYKTVADMKKATNLDNGSICKTLGYYEVGDGGASDYIITDLVESTKYQETLDNGLYASLILTTNANVECFGAKGDAINDDSEAFINALKSNIQNIHLNNKDYLIKSNNISIINSKNIIGLNSTIIIPSNNNLKRIFLIESQKNINIIGITFKSTNDKPHDVDVDIPMQPGSLWSNIMCFNISNSKNINIKKCSFINLEYGCKIDGGVGINDNITIDSNYFDIGCAMPIYVGTTSNLNIINNNIYSSKLANEHYHCLYICNLVNNINIENNNFYDSYGSQIQLYAVDEDIDFRNTIIKSCKFLSSNTEVIRQSLSLTLKHDILLENLYIENVTDSIRIDNKNILPITIKFNNVTAKKIDNLITLSDSTQPFNCIINNSDLVGTCYLFRCNFTVLNTKIDGSKIFVYSSKDEANNVTIANCFVYSKTGSEYLISARENFINNKYIVTDTFIDSNNYYLFYMPDYNVKVILNNLLLSDDEIVLAKGNTQNNVKINNCKKFIDIV